MADELRIRMHVINRCIDLIETIRNIVYSERKTEVTKMEVLIKEVIIGIYDGFHANARKTSAFHGARPRSQCDRTE